MFDIYLLIESKFSQMTSSARGIAKIILDKKEKIAHEYNISRLAAEAHVSNAMVVKFCKSLGLDGFDELKYLIKYHPTKNNIDDTNNYAQEIVSAIQTSDANIMNQKAIIAKQMKVKNNVFIIARSTSANYAFDFFYRLSKIRENVSFERHEKKQKSLLDQIHSDDLIFIVSNSGNSTELIKFAKELNTKHRVETVLVTNNRQGKIAKYATHILEGVSLEVEELFRSQAPASSKYALSYILDAIFYEYFYLDYKANLKKLHQYNFANYTHVDIVKLTENN